MWDSFFGKEIIGFNSGFSLIFFIFLYFIGAYIRTYGAFWKDFNKYTYIFVYLILGLLTGLLQFFIPVVDFLNYNGPFELIMSYSFFMFISKIKVRSNKISTIASYVLSVYLVHEQSQIREFIWSRPLIHQIIEWSPITFIPAIILVAVMVFILSWIIGYILANLYNKIEGALFPKLEKRLQD